MHARKPKRRCHSPHSFIKLYEDLNTMLIGVLSPNERSTEMETQMLVVNLKIEDFLTFFSGPAGPDSPPEWWTLQLSRLNGTTSWRSERCNEVFTLLAFSWPSRSWPHMCLWIKEIAHRIYELKENYVMKWQSFPNGGCYIEEKERMPMCATKLSAANHCQQTATKTQRQACLPELL